MSAAAKPAGGTGLKPCPFCGSSHVEIDEMPRRCWRVRCIHCWALSPTGTNAKDAAEQWNLRAEPLPAPPMQPRGVAPASAWQPISTAPTNGQRILAYSAKYSDRENGGIAVVFARRFGPFERFEEIKGSDVFQRVLDGAWVCWDGAEISSWEPTHWMPLPAPPTERIAEATQAEG